MRIAGFDFRPALVPSIAFVLLFPLLLGLGLWQLSRGAEKQALVEAEAARLDAQAVDLNRAFELAAGDRFRPAVVTGRYRNERHWLLDNRVWQGQPGYHVFSLFAPEGPQRPLLLVDRGWVPVGPSRDLLPAVAAPEGQVVLRGRLDRPASVALELDTVELAGLAPVTVQQHLKIAELSAALGQELWPYTLVLDDGQPGLFQRDWQPGTTITPEKHLGYAVQWFGLAVALLIIYLGVNTRRVSDASDDRHATR